MLNKVKVGGNFDIFLHWKFHFFHSLQTNRQTDRQMDRQTDGQMDRRTSAMREAPATGAEAS